MSDLVERLRQLARHNGRTLTAEDTMYWKAAGRIAELEGKRDAATRALADAIECVEAWSAYAGEYFQEKHDLAGDLARLRAALSKTEKQGC